MATCRIQQPLPELFERIGAYSRLVQTVGGEIGLQSSCRRIGPPVSQSMILTGSAVCISRRMGPKGDSPSGAEKDTCPTYATCLFRNVIILLSSLPLNSCDRAAARILSRWMIIRNFSSDSRLVPVSLARPYSFSSPSVMISPEKRLVMAFLTFSGFSVGLISASATTRIFSVSGLLGVLV